MRNEEQLQGGLGATWGLVFRKTWGQSMPWHEEAEQRPPVRRTGRCFPHYEDMNCPEVQCCPHTALMGIPAQMCLVSLLCVPVLPAFPLRCETWKISLGMGMIHWVGRVSSWEFMPCSLIKCRAEFDRVDHLQMRGRSDSQGAKCSSSVTRQQPEEMDISFIYWGGNCQQVRNAPWTEWIPCKAA